MVMGALANTKLTNLHAWKWRSIAIHTVIVSESISVTNIVVTDIGIKDVGRF